jgi:cyanophycin synthetase
MRDRSGGDIVLFSTVAPGENPVFDDHIERGGIGARVEDGEFVIRRGRLRIPIATQREVPLMMGGAARFQQQNVLAAILAAYVQGVRYDTIRAGLLSFFPSPSMTPGRLNLLRLGEVRVLVDYAHNPAAVEGLVETVQALPARRRVGVVGAPGDRRDEDIRGLGRLCAVLDHAFVKEDTDLRGRDPGEAAALVAEGLREGGMSEDRIEMVGDEFQAVDRAMGAAEAGDLVMVLADKVDAVLKHVQKQAPEPH